MNEKEKYIELLKNHDWYYEMSDDHNVWKRGLENEREIKRLMKLLDPHKELYKQYSSQEEV
jgi:hypothetical protein